MKTIDLYLSGDNAVIDFEMEYLLEGVTLYLHNNQLNPAKQIYFNLPELDNDDELQWQSKIRHDGLISNLIVSLKNSTHISTGNLYGFENILFSDHKILEKTQYGIILDEEHQNNIRLTIDNFKAKSGYIFCSHLNLLNGGIVEKFLGIKNSIPLPDINFILGNSGDDLFIIKKLEFASPINNLLLDHVRVNGSFNLTNVNKLVMKECNILLDSEYDKIQQIKNLGIKTQGLSSKVSADSVTISKLIGERGKFYISAKSYIDFKLSDNGHLRGIDLILDMQDSNLSNKTITFPAEKFTFDLVKIINAEEVFIPFGGNFRSLELIHCSSVHGSNLNGGEISYIMPFKTPGRVTFNSVKVGHLIAKGEVRVILRDIEAEVVEGKELCNITIYGNSSVVTLKNNLDLDEKNKDGQIKSQKAVIYLENTSGEKIFIKQILGKISTFHVKGDIELGNIVIQTINKVNTHLWVQFTDNSKLKLDSLMISHDHGFLINQKTGEIIIQKQNNMITSQGDVNAQVSSATVNDWLYVKAGNSIRFNGSISIIQGDFGLFAGRGDISINGQVISGNAIVLSSQYGRISACHSTLKSDSIVVYAQGSFYPCDSILKATEEMVIYSLSKYIAISSCDLTAPYITLVSKGDVKVSNSKINSNLTLIKSELSASFNNSQLFTEQLFLHSTYDFILAKSGINLKQHNHNLFLNNDDTPLDYLKGGISVIDDITVIGIFNAKTSSIQKKYDWKMVDFESEIILEPGSAYIDSRKGYIIGSQIDTTSNVIIKTRESLEVVPLTLYNETLSSGGFNKDSIMEVASKINAGLIDIDAGKVAVFIGSLLKAAIGKVRAEDLLVLASPKEIQAQQERVKILKQWDINDPETKFTIGKYFNFQQSTSISQRIGNLTVYDDYISPELSFTQEGGDFVIDKSITKYEKLHLNAKDGKLLIVSKNLQHIYANQGGSEAGKRAAEDSRIVIGGDYVYLSADDIVISGSKVRVVNDLKIITKNGVQILPVSVHERLMYHQGSKATVEEYTVRKVISDINAGYLEIKAGGAMRAVSALINATGVKIDASSLELSGEKEIFEKQVHFRGKKKWHGGRQSSDDVTRDELVLPTIINTQGLAIEITGDTTIEAANILASGDSFLKSGGDIKIMPLYNIHLHDHVSKKSSLFSFERGGLKINSTKTVKEHFYGQASVPTLYYSGGEFYGYSNGSIHLLGAKLIGNDIYLSAMKGVKIEACPFTEEEFISVSESGMRIGFNSSQGTHTLSSELFEKLSSTAYQRTLYEASEVIARNNLVISTEGVLEVISSHMQFDKAFIKVRDLKVSTTYEQISVKSSESSKSLGVHVGIKEGFSGVTERVGDLANKKGTHWLDILDRSLKIYQLAGDINGIIHDIEILSQTSGALFSNENVEKLQELQMVKAGVWIGANTSNTSNQQALSRAVDNIFRGGDLQIIASNAADIEGINCIVDNFKLKTKSLNVKASADNRSSMTYHSEVSLTIPICGNIPLEASISNNKGESRQTNFHIDNKIQAFGTMEIEVETDGKISGVKLQAGKVYIRAKNLMLESLQDVLEERMKNVSVGFSIGATSASFSAVAGKNERSAAWTKAIGQIIGNELVNIVVEQTLEIAGGLIVNAELDVNGKLTDKGKLSLQAGNIITRKLHNYDNGKSYGIGVNLSNNLNKEGDKEYGLGMPIKYGFNEQNRDILPTISGGCIAIINEDKALQEKQLSSINRNIGNHIGSTSGSKAGLDATIPVGALLGYESNNFQKLYDYFAGEKVTGVSAGDVANEEPIEDKDKEEISKEKLVELLTQEMPLEDLDIDIIEKVTMALLEPEHESIVGEKFEDATIMAYKLYQFYLEQELPKGLTPQKALEYTTGEDSTKPTKLGKKGPIPFIDSVFNSAISMTKTLLLGERHSGIKAAFELLNPSAWLNIEKNTFEKFFDEVNKSVLNVTDTLETLPMPSIARDFASFNEMHTDSKEMHGLLSKLNVVSYHHDVTEIEKNTSGVCSKVIASKNDLNSAGYTAFACIQDKNIIMVHKGTDGSFCKKDSTAAAGQCLKAIRTDFADDLSLFRGVMPNQYKKAVHFYDHIKASYPEYTIIHTGHSLGGTYAELLAIKNGEQAISFDSPGVMDIARKLLTADKIRDNRHLITAIKAGPNMINTHGEQIASTIIQVNFETPTESLKETNMEKLAIIFNKTNLQIIQGLEINLRHTLYQHSIENIRLNINNQQKMESWPGWKK